MDVVDVVEAIVAEDLTEVGEVGALGEGNGVEVEASGEGNGVEVKAAEAVGAQHGAGPTMPPPSSKVRHVPCPIVLEDRFNKSATSAGGSSSATVVTDASASQSSTLKRVRGGEGKLDPTPLDEAMECDNEDRGSATTDPAPDGDVAESGDSDDKGDWAEGEARGPGSRYPARVRGSGSYAESEGPA